MALDIDPSKIAEALRRNVESWKPTVERGEVGRVTETADGVARVQGLPGAMANELLEFPGGIFGLAFNLDVDEIGCIILGESDKIEEGDAVKQTGTILSMPVGDGVLGRVVDALGRAEAGECEREVHGDVQDSGVLETGGELVEAVQKLLRAVHSDPVWLIGKGSLPIGAGCKIKTCQSSPIT